jgi:hypothetical protein
MVVFGNHEDEAVEAGDGLLPAHGFMQLGPDEILMAATLDFNDDMSAPQLEEAADNLTKKLKAADPRITRVFLRPVLVSGAIKLIDWISPNGDANYVFQRGEEFIFQRRRDRQMLTVPYPRKKELLLFCEDMYGVKFPDNFSRD